MRSEIRRICKTSGLTTTYVTHDQKEALSVADRIAVMRAGRLAQVGTPADLYHRPANSFVAGFIGQSNLLPGKIVGREDGTVRVETAVGPIIAAAPAGPERDDVVLSVRPEQMRITDSSTGSRHVNRLIGRTIETTFLGEASEHAVAINGTEIRVISAPPLFQVPPE